MADPSITGRTADRPALVKKLFSAVLNAVYRKPFGLEDVSLSGLALLSDGDSDITFYDNRQAVLGLGATYCF